MEILLQTITTKIVKFLGGMSEKSCHGTKQSIVICVMDGSVLLLTVSTKRTYRNLQSS